MDVDLDTRFSRVRTEETVIANLLSDLFRSYYDSDFGLVNGGSIRSDEYCKKGQHKAKVIAKMLPLND